MNGQFKFGEITPIKYFFAVGLVLVGLFTFVGDDENILFSFVRWLLQVLIPLGLIIVLHVVLSKLKWFNHQNPWLQLTISGVLGAFLFSPLALQLDVLTGNESLGSRHYFSALFNEFNALVVPVTLAWVGMNSPWVLGYQLVRDKHQTHSIKKRRGQSNTLTPSFTQKEYQKEQSEYLPAFMQLLPDDVRASLLYMKSELHYLSVHTESGKALILYNLKDAINELDTELGIKPHRSYWVAKSAVKSFQKKGREGVLKLVDGSEIPVSRSKTNEVKTCLLK